MSGVGDRSKSFTCDDVSCSSEFMDADVAKEIGDAGITMAAGSRTVVDGGSETAAQVPRIGGNMFGVADCLEIEDGGVVLETDLVGEAATVFGDSGAEMAIGGDTVGVFENKVQFDM